MALAVAKIAAVTAPSMVMVAAVEPTLLCSSKSNVGQRPPWIFTACRAGMPLVGSATVSCVTTPSECTAPSARKGVRSVGQAAGWMRVLSSCAQDSSSHDARRVSTVFALVINSSRAHVREEHVSARSTDGLDSAARAGSSRHDREAVEAATSASSAARAKTALTAQITRRAARVAACVVQYLEGGKGSWDPVGGINSHTL